MLSGIRRLLMRFSLVWLRGEMAEVKGGIGRGCEGLLDAGDWHEGGSLASLTAFEFRST